MRSVLHRDRARGAPGDRAGAAGVDVTGANLFTEPYLLTGGGGPNGASTSPVLLMYQKGIEQGNPDVAAAIGVVLVVLVLIIALISRQNREGGDMSTSRRSRPPTDRRTVDRRTAPPSRRCPGPRRLDDGALLVGPSSSCSPSTTW